jgi:hypothetical protein
MKTASRKSFASRRPRMGCPPPARVPRPASGETELAGKRVVLVVLDEMGHSHYVHDWRATSEPELDAAGDGFVWVVPEDVWYAHRGVSPQNARQWPVGLVWVE